MPVDETHWHPARLIPTTGIGGAAEQEMRATSALLAVIAAVPEFGRSLLSRNFGAPRARTETFVEVPFTLPSGDEVRPDGVIRVNRSPKPWVALVEVKTSRNPLKKDQVENYLDVARDQGFDAVLTISNQFSPVTGQHPVAVNRQKLRRVALHHLSWTAILTEAVLQHEHRGISDPDQAWILGELIAYLSHEKSGVMRFDDMGPSWTEVRNGARAGTLGVRSPAVADIVARWDELARYMCLRLGRELGTNVSQFIGRRDLAEPDRRRASMIKQLVDDGLLSCRLRVPDAVGDLTVAVDLKARTVSVSTGIGVPEDRGAKARVSWLVRQLKDAPESTRIDVHFANRRRASSRLLGALRDDAAAALTEAPNRVPRLFGITSIEDMGVKTGSGQGSFVRSTVEALEDFYRDVVQGLREWSPPAPKLPVDSVED